MTVGPSPAANRAMDNRQLKFVAFADSTAHGYGSGDVFPLVEEQGCVATTSGGSLLLGNQDKQPSIAQVVINNWPKVATMVGIEPAQFLMTKVKVGIIPGRDSTAGDLRYDKLSNCRSHFGIPEGEKTINSYSAWCHEKYGQDLYGTARRKKLHFIGGVKRAKEIFRHIAKCQAEEVFLKQTDPHVLPLVICCGWNVLPQSEEVSPLHQVVIHQEHQAVKSMQHSAQTWQEVLQILVCFSGNNINDYWHFWMEPSGSNEALWWLPKRRCAGHD